MKRYTNPLFLIILIGCICTLACKKKKEDPNPCDSKQALVGTFRAYEAYGNMDVTIPNSNPLAHSFRFFSLWLPYSSDTISSFVISNYDGIYLEADYVGAQSYTWYVNGYKLNSEQYTVDGKSQIASNFINIPSYMLPQEYKEYAIDIKLEIVDQTVSNCPNGNRGNISSTKTLFLENYLKSPFNGDWFATNEINPSDTFSFHLSVHDSLKCSSNTCFTGFAPVLDNIPRGCYSYPLSTFSVGHQEIVIGSTNKCNGYFSGRIVFGKDKNELKALFKDEKEDNNPYVPYQCIRK